jgi:hypothetical protein
LRFTPEHVAVAEQLSGVKQCDAAGRSQANTLAISLKQSDIQFGLQIANLAA